LELTNNIIIWALLLASLVASVVCTIMIKNLLKAAISLAVASAVLTVIMYLMGATLAAVLELSVCAGLITAVFVSTISMTKPSTDAEQTAENKQWLKRVIYLPIILVAAGACTWMLWPHLPLSLTGAVAGADIATRQALWDSPELAIFGQILVVLAGVFGVIVLFRGKAVKK
jgi:NADH-quinone oxidoreductase subunit J